MGNTVDVLVMLGQLILALSILVGVHEAGHLLAAKFFGMRVEQFSIGFPPKIFGFKYKGTVYSVGAIPLGGFVKISGMIDESLDLKSMQQEPQPYEFRAKPAWQRLIVMLGGIIVNVITGILIFIALTFYLGESYISIAEVNKRGVVPGELGKEIGFEKGDKIVGINGQTIEKFNDLISPDHLLTDGGYYTVLRDGREIDLPIPGNFVENFSKDDAEGEFIMPIYSFSLGEISKKSGAEKAGLKKGDKIISIGGVPIENYYEFTKGIKQYTSKTVTLGISRPTDAERTSYINISKDVEIDENGKVGFLAVPEIELTQVEYSLIESIPRGTARAFSVVWVNARAFGKIFRGELSLKKSLKGPIGIMEAFGPTWDWVRFWSLTGLISMILAFMNLLPIPALDGGHVVFLMYEIVSGRKPSDRFLENAQKVGMVLLLLLMVFVFYNDIVNFFSSGK
jgi:regulator of sigma E protease